MRIVRACHDLGVATVVVYSEADANSLPVQMADEAVCVGPATASASYLNVPHIIGAALNTEADAIHPGAGFLAENAYFAEVCSQYRIKFIGPSPATIRAMGDKAQAREVAREAGLPLVPGSGVVRDVVEAKEAASQLGFPVMIKAVSGGGGKGIRPVSDEGELASVFLLAEAEARSSFGNGNLYIERVIDSPRHIEVQVLGDGKEVLHFWHRECSIQRRYQKLVEEAPAPKISTGLSTRITDAAVRLMRQLNYEGAGTVEFLLDADGQFFFIEVNTRIQVEHPVTESITGVDLVKAQMQIAAGESLGIRQRDILPSGHAFEFRIIAEDPAQDFRPDAGVISRAQLPGGLGVRIDTHIFTDYEVPPYYDSLLAKIIVWGESREEALARARRALAETIVDGPATNLDFHRLTVIDPAFAEGVYTAGHLTTLPERVAEALT